VKRKRREPDFTNDDLFFGTVILRAEILALRSILAEVCRHTGFVDPDGLTEDDRYYRQRWIELDKLFRSLEDGNPALAARLHEKYEAAREKLGEDRS
jgi:hypothetical protein